MRPYACCTSTCLVLSASNLALTLFCHLSIYHLLTERKYPCLQSCWAQAMPFFWLRLETSHPQEKEASGGHSLLVVPTNQQTIPGQTRSPCLTIENVRGAVTCSPTSYTGDSGMAVDVSGLSTSRSKSFVGRPCPINRPGKQALQFLSVSWDQCLAWAWPESHQIFGRQLLKAVYPQRLRFLSMQYIHATWLHLYIFNLTRKTAGTAESPACQQTTCDIQINVIYY